MTLHLPPIVKERNLIGFLLKISEKPDSLSIKIDFKDVRWYIPAAVVALVSRMKYWQSIGLGWELVNFKENPVSGYFQRMDVLNVLGVELEENFNRRNTNHAFVPLKEVENAAQTESVATSHAQCIDSTKGDIFRLMQYSCSEMILNALQHSEENGFVASQYNSKDDFIRFSVADFGRGIRQSFLDRNVNFFNQSMSDVDAIRVALKPEISSTTHLSDGPYKLWSNAGVGLSMASEIVRMTCGEMILISGSGSYYQNGNSEGRFMECQSFKGTLVAVSFKKSEVSDFNQMSKQARVSLGLQKLGDHEDIFLD
jgi:hypothetical protein